MTYRDILDRSMIDRHHSALDVVWGDRYNSANREVPVSGEPGPMPEPSLNLGPSGRPIGNVDVSQKNRHNGIGRIPEHDNAAVRRNRGSGVLRPCLENFPHDLKFNGKDKSTGKLRIKCLRCGQTREATAEESARWTARRERITAGLPVRAGKDCGHRNWSKAGSDYRDRPLVQCRTCGIKRLRESVVI